MSPAVGRGFHHSHGESLCGIAISLEENCHGLHRFSYIALSRGVCFFKKIYCTRSERYENDRRINGVVIDLWSLKFYSSHVLIAQTAKVVRRSPRLRKATPPSSDLFRRRSKGFAVRNGINSCWQWTRSKDHVRLTKHGSFLATSAEARQFSENKNPGASGIVSIFFLLPFFRKRWWVGIFVSSDKMHLEVISTLIDDTSIRPGRFCSIDQRLGLRKTELCSSLETLKQPKGFKPYGESLIAFKYTGVKIEKLLTENCRNLRKRTVDSAPCADLKRICMGFGNLSIISLPTQQNGGRKPWKGLFHSMTVTSPQF